MQRQRKRRPRWRSRRPRGVRQCRRARWSRVGGMIFGKRRPKAAEREAPAGFLRVRHTPGWGPISASPRNPQPRMAPSAPIDRQVSGIKHHSSGERAVSCGNALFQSATKLDSSLAARRLSQTPVGKCGLKFRIHMEIWTASWATTDASSSDRHFDYGSTLKVINRLQDRE